MSGHTREPWTVQIEPDVGFRVVAPCLPGIGPGLIHVVARGIQIKADARLIAAAPELLEACRAAIQNSDKTLAEDGGLRRPECQRVYDMVSAAIAEAEGER